MLCQFTAKNFQCFKDELTLDMQATAITEHEETVFTDGDGERFLPLAAIYGPNGGGKSTVIKALYALASKIMYPISVISEEGSLSVEKISNRFIEPFKFSPSTLHLPTEFELFFRTKTYEYQYQLSVLRDKVISESLYRKEIKDKARYSMIFDRQGSNSRNIILRNSLKKYEVSGISETLTLLSFFGITHRRNSIIKDIVDWFETYINFVNYGNPKRDAQVMLVDSEADKAAILKMIDAIGLDITDYRVEEKESGQLQVYTRHTVNGKIYELSMDEESNGTVKMFGMLTYILDSLQNGGTLVIDELDAKLHPLLLRYIIDLYRDPKFNKHFAQLIFTSHDLTTMNSKTFRRDEIWFAAKGDDSSSKLYSLVELKERKDADYSKRYLEGHYGADPYLRKIIEWGEENVFIKTR